MKLKVCGMRDPGNIAAVAASKPDYLGFIFYNKSPRYIRDPGILFETINLPDSIKKVGVYVNENEAKIKSDIERFSLNMIQLHGNEDVTFCKKISESNVEVMKVFSIGNNFDFKVMRPYVESVDFFLFDTKGKYPGGNSSTFDWEIIKKYPYEVPFFLSGGIGVENIDQVRGISHTSLYGIDVNSRLELAPGVKDPLLLEKFIEKFKAINDR